MLLLVVIKPTENPYKMYIFPVLTCLFFISSHVFSFPENKVPYAEPEVLDLLLETNQHELFSKLMKIENVNLVRPSERVRSERGIFHKELRFGDILPSKGRTEESRQVVNFERFPDQRWDTGEIPVAISGKYSSKQRKQIEEWMKAWNDQVDCIKLSPRIRERDYIYIFPGDGCYSDMGRTGGQQPLSLDTNGCMDKGTLLHEMEHAIGISHEQNRADRDDYIEMLWHNIPEDWHSQYEKTDSRDFNLVGDYDYYSLMHYPVPSPETEEPAFRIKKRGVDAKRVGNADDFTEEDLIKIKELYCGDYEEYE